MKALYAVMWEESERGWGVRPDGCSLHRSELDALAFIKGVQDKQPKDYVPDEYSRPSDIPKLIEVSESLYNYIMAEGDKWLSPNNASAYKTYDASVHVKVGTLS
ncbi:MAG: hypothetical protein ACXW1D_00340 [Halobacteriota archaeon]